VSDQSDTLSDASGADGADDQGSSNADPAQGASTDTSSQGNDAKLAAEAAKWRTQFREAQKLLAEQAARIREIDEAKLSAEERAAQRAADAEARARELESKLAAVEMRQQVVDAALKAKAVDPSTVYALLKDDLTADSNIDAAVKALLKEKPFLVQAAGTGSSANGGQAQTKKMTDAERRQQMYGQGVSFFDPEQAALRGGGVVIPGGPRQLGVEG
jgi:hypothetical protein